MTSLSLTTFGWLSFLRDLTSLRSITSLQLWYFLFIVLIATCGQRAEKGAKTLA